REAGHQRAQLDFRAPGKRWQPVEFRLSTGTAAPVLMLTWSTTDDPRQRSFPLRRFLLPFARPVDEPVTTPATRSNLEITGGNWLRGRRLFFGERLACGKCHSIQGTGGKGGHESCTLT